MKRTKINELLKATTIDVDVLAKGWVRTKRGNNHVNFIALNDGSTINNIQIVVDMEGKDEDHLSNVNTGAAIEVHGKLIKSEGKGQSVEIKATEIIVLGESDPEKYPIQPKKHSLEFLRENAHLRFRTNTFSAVMRIRHNMAFAIHQYFHNNGFYYMNTPIVTGSDAEGAGECFAVTNFDLKNVPMDENKEIDYKKDFFGKETNLTVSGQLEAEAGAMALGQVYTFGPTFRAENSNTSRHLAEFWMIEPEVAFADINDDMDLAEDFIQNVIKFALENCQDDLGFLDKRLEDEERSHCHRTREAFHYWKN